MLYFPENGTGPEEGVHALPGADEPGLTLLEKNALAMEGKFAMNEYGNFGRKSKGARVIATDNPIEDSISFYGQIGRGGVKGPLYDRPEGTRTIMPEGDVVTHRVFTSTKDSPAVDIRVDASVQVNAQKIHFIKGD